MIILDTIDKSLEVLLGGVVATNELPIMVSYVDITTTSFTPASSNTETNGVTPVTIIAAPAASTQRQVKFISIQNKDTASVILTLQLNDNSTIREIIKFVLDSDDTFVYTDGEGFRVLDSNGRIKTVASSGIVSLNSQTGQAQIITQGTAGVDVNIVSAGNVHTINIPIADTTNTGKLTHLAQVIGGVKTFDSFPILPTANPTTDYQAAHKIYVDALAQGLTPKVSVVVATLINGTLASDFENGDTIDTVVLATNDRILIKNQTAQEENGIYLIQASGAPVRATDYDTDAEVDAGTFTFVSGGTQIGLWVQVTQTPTLDTDPLVFSPISAVPNFTASLGVQKVGSDFRLDFVANDGLKLSANSATIDYDNATIGIESNKLALKNTVVTPASYLNANIIVNAKGQLIYAENGVGGSRGITEDYGAASGTDTYTVTLSPFVVAYVLGQGFKIKFTNPNTVTTPTININGLGAKTLVKFDGTAVAAADVKGILWIIYDGTDFRVVGAGGGGGTTNHAALSNLDFASAGHTGFQAALVSGTNIKTVNGKTILGSGDLNTDVAISVGVGDGINVIIANTARSFKALKGNTIVSWEVVGDVTGSIVIDLLKNGVSMIGAGNKPTITSGTSASAAVSGWTTDTYIAGDVLTVKVESNSNFKDVALNFKF
jgi:hypothetical protein